MTTYFPLTPSSSVAPSFTPTLGKDVYLCTVTWNLFGQRYFLNCYDNQNNLVFTVPLVASPRAMPLAALSWDAASLRAFAATSAPHKLRVGSVVRLTVTDCAPSGYDGDFDVCVTSPTTFYYSINSDPGQLVTLGNASFLTNLTKGYSQSKVVFRNGQFEVSP